MRNPFDLNRPLEYHSTADPEDVLNVKRGLGRLGFYRMPGYGLTDMPDEPLFEGVRDFQAGHGLTVDGLMLPGGETVRKLNERLAEDGAVQAAETKGWQGGADSGTGHIPLRPTGPEPLPPGLTEEQVRSMMGKHDKSRSEVIEEYRKKQEFLKQQERQRWRIILGK
ncbi:MAG: peptidoglycan-binding protein [Magnetospirillum sp. WYHS-4]